MPSATWVRAGWKADGTAHPAVSRLAGSTRSLRVAEKWTRFESIARRPVGSASAPDIAPATTSTTVVFKLDAAVGMATVESTQECSGTTSCVRMVAADGTTSSPFAAGSATPQIRDFFTSPTGRLYVVFAAATRLDSSQETCILAEVTVATGATTCVDPAMISISLGNPRELLTSRNPAVQFDPQGRIYYMGRTKTDTYTVLRRRDGSVYTNLVNENITVRDFVVTADGSVVISGSTSGSSQWTRRIAPNGSIQLLAPSSDYLHQFVDGNVYFAAPEKMLRFLGATGELDPIPWINYAQMTSQTTWTPSLAHNDVLGFCSKLAPDNLKQCTMGILFLMNIDGKASLGVRGTGSISQYYPVVKPVALSVITNVRLGLVAGSRIVLIGLDTNGKNTVSVFDPSTLQETVVIGDGAEVEVYSATWVAATGKVMFNGLNFTTGKVEVGEFTLP